MSGYIDYSKAHDAGFTDERFNSITAERLNKVFNESSNDSLTEEIIQYAKNKCKEQRALCAKAYIEDNSGDLPHVSILDAPEPEYE